MMSKNKDNLIWIDLEMTGLNPDTDKIIEIATIVTAPDLTILAEGPVFAIHQTDETLAGMDEWNTKQHGGSGLVARIKESTVTEDEAQAKTIEFLERYAEKGKSPMCGNSICQDRRFLYRHMPLLEQFFHYRNLDVSTLKELARRWRPEVYSGVKKTSSHLALDDVKDSINELQHYREHFIQLKSSKS